MIQAAVRASAMPWPLRHWLALVNLAASVFAALPIVAPALLAAGWHGPALVIYAAYQFTCHQWPARSYFLFGPALVYPMQGLAPAGLGAARDFLGSAALGFKMAYCERDFAIYTTVVVAGLLYTLCRRHARPLPWTVFALCLVPIALDGFTQLFGWRESTWELRTLTGALLGVAGVWLVYPRLDVAVGLAPWLVPTEAGAPCPRAPRDAPRGVVADPPLVADG